jgi:hypothetical protein
MKILRKLNLNCIAIITLIATTVFVLSLLNSRPIKHELHENGNCIRIKNSLYDLKDVSDTVGLQHFPILLKDRKTVYKNYGTTKIPKTIHFIFGLKKDSIFGLIQYLSIASAYVTHKNYVIYLHCVNIPTGFYWDMVSSIVVINVIREVNFVFGNPVTTYAHKADVIRLRVLLKFGGMHTYKHVFSPERKLWKSNELWPDMYHKYIHIYIYIYIYIYVYMYI